MKLIEKIRIGLPLKKTIVDKINEIISYLKATRLVQGPGIRIRETSNGVIVSAVSASRSPDDEDETPTPAPVPAGSVPPGVIMAYAGQLDYMPGENYDDQYINTESGVGHEIPAGWLHCHGQAISRETYAALFAAIGTLYGAGDGQTTFNIPDFRGSFLRGAGHPGPNTVIAHIVYEEVEGEPPVDCGYIDVTNESTEGGSFTYNGETVELDSSAVFTPSGVAMNGALYNYSGMENLTDIYLGGGTATGFIPVGMEGGELQSRMGVQMHEEMPNISGKMMALSQDKYFPAEKYAGVFSVNSMDGRNVLTEFRRTHYNYPSYLTVKGVDTDGNYSKTFNDVEIYWNPSQQYDPEVDGGGSGNVQDNPFANKFPALVVVDYSLYNGQRITGFGNATTAQDYIRQYGAEPPESLLTIKQNTASGSFLPTRHIVHWLIKY